jgi:hypothetical protein
VQQAIEIWPLKSLSEVSEVHRDSLSQLGSCLGSVKAHSLTLAYTPGSLWCDSRASSWPAPLQPLCLGREPKARVATRSLTMITSCSEMVNINYVATCVIIALSEQLPCNWCTMPCLWLGKGPWHLELATKHQLYWLVLQLSYNWLCHYCFST